MTFGYIWTVGQGGFESVNRNLCDLWTNTFGSPPSCQFNKGILCLWGVGALIAAIFLIFEGVRWLSAKHVRLAFQSIWGRSRSRIDAIRYMPLYEAAQRTLNSNIVLSTHSLAVDDIRRLEGNRPEDIITWYCNYLKNKIDIYGCHVPSTKMEKFSRAGAFGRHAAGFLAGAAQPDYDFRVEDSVVIATERSGSGRWERLVVLKSDFRTILGATVGQDTR